MTLQPGNRLGDVFRRGEISDSPTRHRKRFADAVDDDGKVFDFLTERSDGDMFLAVVDEFFVNFVLNNDDIVPHGDFRKAF